MSAMVPAAPPLSFERDFQPEAGTPVTIAPGIVRVTAHNSGPFTFTGTNSFILGQGRVAVIDPGPDEPRHFDALMRAIAGRPADAILLTHTHKDHCALARRLKATTGAPIWFGGRHRLSRPRRFLETNPVAGSSDWGLQPDRVLADGERLDMAGLTLAVMTTPGHCANHLAFGIVGTPVLFTGDHIMGWNSTLVPVPDGSMTDYLASLRKVIAAPYVQYLPAHGGSIADGPRYARALLAHRELRNHQIVTEIRAGARHAGEVLRAIYPGLAPTLRAAARMTLEAHLDHLAASHQILVRHGLFGPTLSAAIP